MADSVFSLFSSVLVNELDETLDSFKLATVLLSSVKRGLFADAFTGDASLSASLLSSFTLGLTTDGLFASVTDVLRFFDRKKLRKNGDFRTISGKLAIFLYKKKNRLERTGVLDSIATFYVPAVFCYKRQLFNKVFLLIFPKN